MSDLNQCTFTGRLGADPEIRHSQDGRPVANLRLAVGAQWRDKSGEKQERTEWVKVVIFSEGLCKVAENYLRKGSRVAISGQLQTRKWQDQSGNDRYSTEIVLQGFNSTLTMLDSRKEGEGQPSQQSDASAYAEQSQGGTVGGVDDDADSIPF